jgi:hypothetical protein
MRKVDERLMGEEKMTAKLTDDVWHNRKGPLAPIVWYGGKYYLARWIMGQFPPDRVY